VQFSEDVVRVVIVLNDSEFITQRQNSDLSVSL